LSFYNKPSEGIEKEGGKRKKPKDYVTKQTEEGFKVKEKPIYSEKLKFPYALIMTPIFGFLSMGFFGLFWYQRLAVHLLPEIIPNWLYLILSILLLRFFLLTLNFSTLSLQITSSGVLISFGLIKRKIEWEFIEECRILKGRFRAIWWRLPLDWSGGRWRNVFQVIGYPQISLGLKKQRFNEVIFSTREPEKVKGIIEKFLPGLTPRGGSNVTGSEIVGPPNPNNY